MKNQYFGDIGDYGKYGLLRFLQTRGIALGINWCLTENDGKTDGRHISYLEKDEFFKYDPELYRHLKEYVIVQKTRDVAQIENSDLLQGATFYHEKLEDARNFIKEERKKARADWHKKGVEVLKDADLIFLDPDNGFRETAPKAIKDAAKYCYASEVADYYNSGANVVFYCHKGRRTDEKWAEAKRDMQNAVPDAKMRGVTFHKGTQRSYIFAIHPEDKKAYERNLGDFLHTNWRDFFTEEPFEGASV